ncbi:MAG: four helix bundle protein [Bacteroidales bacterium]|nr:four helix bundle protein [Bacteroidales bacterium]
MANYRGFRDLKVYQLSFRLAVEIFELSKHFPKEERYSLTDQIRRASRSVPTNISEAWSKRRYPKQFVFKLTDSDGEASETTVWLDFSLNHKYISQETHNYFIEKYHEVGKMLGSMIQHPEKFCY